jgi:hypothetical protein
MSWETFVETCRIGGQDYHVLWQSEFSFDSAARLVGDGRGGIAAFASEAEAHAYALASGERLAEGEPPRQVYDLDAVAGWCEHPDPDALNATALWRAWHLLEDAGVLRIPIALPGEPEFAESDSFDNLAFSALAADSPAEYAPWVRPWRAGELERVAEILGAGVAEFGRRLLPR